MFRLVRSRRRQHNQRPGGWENENVGFKSGFPGRFHAYPLICSRFKPFSTDETGFLSPPLFFALASMRKWLVYMNGELKTPVAIPVQENSEKSRNVEIILPK